MAQVSEQMQALLAAGDIQGMQRLALQQVSTQEQQKFNPQGAAQADTQALQQQANRLFANRPAPPPNPAQAAAQQQALAQAQAQAAFDQELGLLEQQRQAAAEAASQQRNIFELQLQDLTQVRQQQGQQQEELLRLQEEQQQKIADEQAKFQAQQGEAQSRLFRGVERQSDRALDRRNERRNARRGAQPVFTGRGARGRSSAPVFSRRANL